MNPRTRASALERASVYAGIGSLFLTLLLGVATLSPDAFAWIADNATAIGYVALALFGAAILGIFKALLDAIGETALAGRIRRKRARRRVLADQKRARALHGEDLTAWETFYESAQQAIYYSLEVREERLPLSLAWPWFLHYLQECRGRTEALPARLREDALKRLKWISQAIERDGPMIPTGLGASGIVMACLEFRDWLLECRVRRYLDLYRQCGRTEPDWQTRLHLLSADQLESAPLPQHPE